MEITEEIKIKVQEKIDETRGQLLDLQEGYDYARLWVAENFLERYQVEMKIDKKQLLTQILGYDKKRQLLSGYFYYLRRAIGLPSSFWIDDEGSPKLLIAKELSLRFLKKVKAEIDKEPSEKSEEREEEIRLKREFYREKADNVMKLNADREKIDDEIKDLEYKLADKLRESKDLAEDIEKLEKQMIQVEIELYDLFNQGE